jgi:hypothetical protein
LIKLRRVSLIVQMEKQAFISIKLHCFLKFACEFLFVGRNEKFSDTGQVNIFRNELHVAVCK